jgi:acyl carrier protein
MSNTTYAELDLLVRSALSRIAPDVDPETIAADADYRDEVGLDSMDFIAFVSAIERELGLVIPELDYAEITTLRAFTEYLVARTAPSG